MGSLLGRFHHRVERRLSRIQTRIITDGIWVDPHTGRCPAGGGAGDNGDVNIRTPYYGRAVHCYAKNSRPVSEGGSEASIKGTHAVVETCGDGTHIPERD